MEGELGVVINQYTTLVVVLDQAAVQDTNSALAHVQAAGGLEDQVGVKRCARASVQMNVGVGSAGGVDVAAGVRG